MSSSETKTRESQAEEIRVTDDDLIVELMDGRTVSVPIAWYPRLMHGTTGERANWRLIGQGNGIHWPELDEDILVEDLLAGHSSGESQESLRSWLALREKAG